MKQESHSCAFQRPPAPMFLGCIFRTQKPTVGTDSRRYRLRTRQEVGNSIVVRRKFCSQDRLPVQQGPLNPAPTAIMRSAHPCLATTCQRCDRTLDILSSEVGGSRRTFPILAASYLVKFRWVCKCGLFCLMATLNPPVDYFASAATTTGGLGSLHGDSRNSPFAISRGSVSSPNPGFSLTSLTR